MLYLPYDYRAGNHLPRIPAAQAADVRYIGVSVCLLYCFTEHSCEAGQKDAAPQAGERLFLPGEWEGRMRQMGCCKHWETVGRTHNQGSTWWKEQEGSWSRAWKGKVGRKWPLFWERLDGEGICFKLLLFTDKVLWLFCFGKLEDLLYILTKLSSRFVKPFWWFFRPSFRRRCRQMQLQSSSDSGTYQKHFPSPQRKLTLEAGGHRTTVYISICHSTVFAPCFLFFCLSPPLPLHCCFSSIQRSQKILVIKFLSYLFYSPCHSLNSYTIWRRGE